MKFPGFLCIFLKVVSHCWSEAEVAGPVVTKAEDDGTKTQKPKVVGQWKEKYKLTQVSQNNSFWRT